MSSIKADGRLDSVPLRDIPVLNPGDCWGRTWLLEIGGSYWPLYLVVEAEDVANAIDVLADDPQYGHQIVVPPEDLDDYPEEDRHYSSSGNALDLEHLWVYGQGEDDYPWPCTYHSAEQRSGPTDEP